MPASVNHIFSVTDSFSLKWFNSYELYQNYNKIVLIADVYKLLVINMVFIKLPGTVNFDVTFMNFELNDT